MECKGGGGGGVLRAVAVSSIGPHGKAVAREGRGRVLAWRTRPTVDAADEGFVGLLPVRDEAHMPWPRLAQRHQQFPRHLPRPRHHTGSRVLANKGGDDTGPECRGCLRHRDCVAMPGLWEGRPVPRIPVDPSPLGQFLILHVRHFLWGEEWADAQTDQTSDSVPVCLGVAMEDLGGSPEALCVI